MIPQENNAPKRQREALETLEDMLRLPAVLKARGLSRSTIYQQIEDGLFTRPVSLGARAVGWPAGEVQAINAARIAGRTEGEIRDLVSLLEAARKTSA